MYRSGNRLACAVRPRVVSCVSLSRRGSCSSSQLKCREVDVALTLRATAWIMRITCEQLHRLPLVAPPAATQMVRRMRSRILLRRAVVVVVCHLCDSSTRDWTINNCKLSEFGHCTTITRCANICPRRCTALCVLVERGLFSEPRIVFAVG